MNNPIDHILGNDREDNLDRDHDFGERLGDLGNNAADRDLGDRTDTLGDRSLDTDSSDERGPIDKAKDWVDDRL
jgi:hypothetical protein